MAEHSVARTSTEKWIWRRREVIIRDNYTCQKCGDQGAYKGEARLEVHHKTPVRDGGSDDLDNLITYCRACHQSITTNRLWGRQIIPDRFIAAVAANLARCELRGIEERNIRQIAKAVTPPKAPTPTELIEETASDSRSPLVVDGDCVRLSYDERCEVGRFIRELDAGVTPPHQFKQ